MAWYRLSYGKYARQVCQTKLVQRYPLEVNTVSPARIKAGRRLHLEGELDVTAQSDTIAAQPRINTPCLGTLPRSLLRITLPEVDSVAQRFLVGATYAARLLTWIGMLRWRPSTALDEPITYFELLLDLICATSSLPPFLHRLGSCKGDVVWLLQDLGPRIAGVAKTWAQILETFCNSLQILSKIAGQAILPELTSDFKTTLWTKDGEQFRCKAAKQRPKLVNPSSVNVVLGLLENDRSTSLKVAIRTAYQPAVSSPPIDVSNPCLVLPQLQSYKQMETKQRHERRMARGLGQMVNPEKFEAHAFITADGIRGGAAAT
ncbi:unnamed protein product [Polarella glacialis]|uniref:Uncharacterized protein n=1 Tax=Polarella glacialis TaxID=89957 RepID=A0A813IKC2_POLGL|nr:unnamed protein product [Polarella glacialis]CAE8650696.1 unnamed protein product [Polarella glacialis]